MGASLDPNTTIINIWKSWGNGWERELAEVTHDGYRAVLSAPWYLNYIKYGSDWVPYYEVDPTNFPGTPQQKSRVLGGEICLWGELVNSINVTPRAKRSRWGPVVHQKGTNRRLPTRPACRKASARCWPEGSPFSLWSVQARVIWACRSFKSSLII